MTVERVSSRGYRVAELIRDRVPFKTSGALKSSEFSLGVGILSDAADLTRWHQDANGVTYVVYSYDTPIAWYTPDRGWYKVGQRFSVTTSKHQGKLYLIGTDGRPRCERCQIVHVRDEYCPHFKEGVLA